MTHVVYLVMMMTASGAPQQMAEEPTMKACMADIVRSATEERGDNRTNWYCQPAVSNITLGPRQ
jgi:hypothetical protein